MNEWDENDYPHGDLTQRIIGAAIKVHPTLGPGLLESAYQMCLADEMTRQGIRFCREVELPVVYEGRSLDCGYRLDFLVDDAVILELKCIDMLQPIHDAQLRTYLRLSGRTVGLLMNFNVTRLRDGIVRKVLAHCASTSFSSASSAPQR